MSQETLNNKSLLNKLKTDIDNTKLTPMERNSSRKQYVHLLLDMHKTTPSEDLQKLLIDQKEQLLEPNREDSYANWLYGRICCQIPFRNTYVRLGAEMNFYIAHVFKNSSPNRNQAHMDSVSKDYARELTTNISHLYELKPYTDLPRHIPSCISRFIFNPQVPLKSISPSSIVLNNMEIARIVENMGVGLKRLIPSELDRFHRVLEVLDAQKVTFTRNSALMLSRYHSFIWGDMESRYPTWQEEYKRTRTLYTNLLVKCYNFIAESTFKWFEPFATSFSRINGEENLLFYIAYETWMKSITTCFYQASLIKENQEMTKKVKDYMINCIKTAKNFGIKVLMTFFMLKSFKDPVLFEPVMESLLSQLNTVSENERLAYSSLNWTLFMDLQSINSKKLPNPCVKCGQVLCTPIQHDLFGPIDQDIAAIKTIFANKDYGKVISTFHSQIQKWDDRPLSLYNLFPLVKMVHESFTQLGMSSDEFMLCYDDWISRLNTKDRVLTLKTLLSISPLQRDFIPKLTIPDSYSIDYENPKVSHVIKDLEYGVQATEAYVIDSKNHDYTIRFFKDGLQPITLKSEIQAILACFEMEILYLNRQGRIILYNLNKRCPIESEELRHVLHDNVTMYPHKSITGCMNQQHIVIFRDEVYVFSKKTLTMLFRIPTETFLSDWDRTDGHCSCVLTKSSIYIKGFEHLVEFNIVNGDFKKVWYPRKFLGKHVRSLKLMEFAIDEKYAHFCLYFPTDLEMFGEGKPKPKDSEYRPFYTSILSVSLKDEEFTFMNYKQKSFDDLKKDFECGIIDNGIKGVPFSLGNLLITDSLFDLAKKRMETVDFDLVRFEEDPYLVSAFANLKEIILNIFDGTKFARFVYPVVINDKERTCKFCQNEISETPKVCGKCMKVSYCSRDCQMAHWNAHKYTC